MAVTPTTQAAAVVAGRGPPPDWATVTRCCCLYPICVLQRRTAVLCPGVSSGSLCRKNVIVFGVLFGSQCTCTVSLSFIATRVYEQCRSERSVHSIGTTVPAFFTFTGSKSRQAATCIRSARMGAAALQVCTFRLMLTPPSRSSPRWRWHALSEALEETSCRGWHLRDSKPQAAARLSCRGGRTVSYRVR